MTHTIEETMSDTSRGRLVLASGFRRALRAELRKSLRRGGMRGWWIVSVALAALVSLTTMLSTHAPPDAGGNSSLAATDLAGIGPSVSLLLLSIGLAAYVAREVADGTVVSAKLAFPGRNGLLAARVASSAVLVAAASIATAVPFAIAGWFDPAVERSTPALLLLAVALSVVVPSMVAALVHCGAIIVRLGAYIMTVGLTVLVILPVLGAVGNIFLPAPWGRVSGLVGESMAGTLAVKAMALPNAEMGSWGGLVVAFLGLLAWLAACGLWADRVFRCPGYGEV